METGMVMSLGIVTDLQRRSETGMERRMETMKEKRSVRRSEKLKVMLMDWRMERH